MPAKAAFLDVTGTSTRSASGAKDLKPIRKPLPLGGLSANDGVREQETFLARRRGSRAGVRFGRTARRVSCVEMARLLP